MEFDKKRHIGSARKAYAKLVILWKVGFVNLDKEGVLKLLTSEQLFELAVHLIGMLIETEAIPDGEYEEVCKRIFESLITIDEDDEMKDDDDDEDGLIDTEDEVIGAFEDGLIDTEERDFLLEVIGAFEDGLIDTEERDFLLEVIGAFEDED